MGGRNVGKALKGRVSTERDQVPHLQDWWGSLRDPRTMKREGTMEWVKGAHARQARPGI